ncbi:hypothetical protein [Paraliobacillus ryukyuensis]|uniref:hypothetical protein n=1 Tax=Paraliobacillus ryukyuensis TaxID=200904 RepID=UPI0009A5C4E7|nr:hypothetical protein [Paraliobacillus ryukyuensis]
MFNFGTIGAYKQVRNNPRCKATAETKNGQVVVLDEVNKTASFPADAAAAKVENLYIVNNADDKPETWTTKDFVVKEGEFLRNFRLADLVDMPVLLSHDVISTTYTDVAAGDILVAEAATGNWVKADGTTIVATDYPITLEVVSKNTFGDQGVEAIVRA